MYTEEEGKVRLPLVRFLISLILVILFILLLVWLLSKAGFNNDNGYEGLKNRMFNDNIQTMKETGILYFTEDRLPEKVGDTVTITLGKMIDSKYILPIKDFDGNKCDTDRSFISLTKKDSYYQMMVNLKCGEEEDYILVDIGCYSYCESTYLCEKEIKPTPKPNPTPTPNQYGPSCELVANGTLGTNGWFVSNVTISFKSKKPGNNASIVNYSLYQSGGSPSSTNNDKYTITKDGETTVIGYVKDSKGRTATCRITVKRDTVKPSCSLSVLSGTKDSDGVYISNVVVGLNKNDSTSKVKSFGMDKVSTPVYNSKDKYTVTENGKTKVYGYVKDNAGNTAICDLTVNKKATTPISVPSCVLEVKSGTLSNGVYISNVTIGFKNKTSTNGATITAYGLGKTENYANNNTYIVNQNGNHTIYGYVKDSNGKKAVCSIKINRQVPDPVSVPACNLEVKSGTLENNYYLSNVTIGFKNKQSTNGATISAFGLGLSSTTTTYANNTSYIVKNNGATTVYGYVKDSKGKTATCYITVTKKTKQYEYSKNIPTQYSNWSAWQTYTYNPANKPNFGNYALIQIEDLGKTTVVDYYKEEAGQAIYQNIQVKVGTAQQTYCTGYTYYRTTTSQTTYAIKEGTGWVYKGMVTTTGGTTNTLSVKYEFVGFDWECTGCERVPRKIWNKYTREVGTVTNTNTVVTSGVTTSCTSTAVRTIDIYDYVSKFVRYDIIRVPVYKDVYNYRRRTRTVVKEAYTDYKWSTYNDTTLINNGYTKTGKTRVVV